MKDMTKTPRKFFIDTDAGTDDAVALIMAMRCPQIDIVGISTSGGNVPLDCVVQNVLYIRELCGHTAPVYVGAAKPIMRTLDTADFIHGKDGLGDIGLDLSGRSPEEGGAQLQLALSLKKHAGDIEIVCLGPLTNLALIEQKEPGILSLAKRIYIMGGLVTLPGNITSMSEYNIWADPEAAQIVLQSDARFTMIGWDTTCASSAFSVEEIEAFRDIDTGFAHLVADIQRVRIKWMHEHKEESAVNLADPLAMAVAMDKSLIERKEYFTMSVRGGAHEDPYRGFIDATPTSDDRGVEFIHIVDRERYINLLKSSMTEEGVVI